MSEDDLIKKAKKQFGEGAVFTMDSNAIKDVDVISTQCIALDRALGVGGLPKGRITEIFGDESSGKTTLAQHVIAEAQRQGGRASFIDAEHAFDPQYARNLGIDTNKMFISQPDTGEEALQIAEFMVESGAIDVVLVDSVSSLLPKAELDGEIGQSHVGLQARLMSQFLRKLSGLIKKKNVVFIFINQIREKVGVTWGSPKTTSGGKALRFYSSVRMEIARTGSLKKQEEVIGNTTKVTVKKNKVAPPFKKAEFNIIYGEGIDIYNEYIKEGIRLGLIEKNSTWFKYNDEPVAQGLSSAIEWLKENPEVLNEIKEKL